MNPVGVTARRLVVNADDLGQSVGINRGISEAVEHGIVTSASLMVRWPAAEAAAAWARAHPEVSVGLHLDLGEWAYRKEAWVPVYQVVDTDAAGAVDDELSRQLGRFLRLMGRPPTHLDSHQHVHRSEPLRSRMAPVAARLRVPLRGVAGAVRYCGAFYGQGRHGEPHPEGITFGALIAILDSLSDGATELGCHPGADGLADVDSMYLAERGAERAVLCDPRLPGELARRGIGLGSFIAIRLPPIASEQTD